MSREIKFRVWDKADKVMLFDAQNVYDSPYVAPTNKDGEELKDWTGASSFGDFLEDSENYEVMQFTGLRDKNGKEIYEGDLIDHKTYFGPPLEVYWNAKGCGWSLRRTENGEPYTSMALSDLCIPNLEVIGNIHENQDLVCRVEDKCF